MTTKGQSWDDPQPAVEILKAEQERMLNASEYPLSAPSPDGPRLPPLDMRVWRMPATVEVVRAGAKLQAENEWLQELDREAHIEAAREAGRWLGGADATCRPPPILSTDPYFAPEPPPEPASLVAPLPPSVTAGEPLILPWFARPTDRKKK